MSKNKKKHRYRFRTDLLAILRMAALFGLILTVLFIGVGFYRGSSYKEFRLKPQDKKLSEEVISEVNGYERREIENNVTKYYIKASRAKTFSDKHQELEGVFLQIFDKLDVKSSDKVTANKAIYIPEEGTKNFRIYFVGNVNIETRHDLKIKTEQIVYSKIKEIAESEEQITFNRENVSGKSLGAILNIGEKTLELKKEAEIEVQGKKPSKLSDSNIKHAKIKAGHAFIEQEYEKITMKGGVDIALVPNDKVGEGSTRSVDIKANEAVAYFSERKIKQIDSEEDDGGYQKPNSSNPNLAEVNNSASGTADGELEKLKLYENVYIKMAGKSSMPTVITSDTASYERKLGKIYLTGNAELKRGKDLVRGDSGIIDLFPNEKVRYVRVNGRALLRQQKPEGTTEVAAVELNATFSEDQELQAANATGDGRVVIIPSEVKEYKKLSLLASNAINLHFRNDGTLEIMNTQGRTTINLDASGNSPDAANKILVANMISAFFRSDGEELENAEAIGNAVLIVNPLHKSANSYKTTITAPQFTCDFYEENKSRSCLAGNDAKMVRVPTRSGKTLEEQMFTSKTMHVFFNKDTQEVERFDANGQAKFSEGSRGGISDNIIYTSHDRIVRFRGNRPTMWNSQARVRAGEIDWNTKEDTSTYRKGVRATYFSQKRTADTTPFGNPKSPVFLTSNQADFDHNAKIAFFAGNARAWQDSNYVRAEKLKLDQKRGHFYAEDNVQSALYSVERTFNREKSKVTVYASSNKMLYQRDKKLLSYEENVDIRQGTDRIVGEIAKVFLKEHNELSSAIIERDVFITQPKRHASGNYAKYTAHDENLILRGNPVRVSDAENGSSSGLELTMDLKSNRVVGKGKSKKNIDGRIRTVYKIRGSELN